MSSSTSGSEWRGGPWALLLRSAAFGLVVMLAGLLVATFGPHIASNDYLAALQAKHLRLHGLGSPKVVLVGGSNLAFGIDSEVLERSLCRPTVNMGVHAGLGFRYMVDEVKKELGPGDVVIVALEYTHYAQAERTDDIMYLMVDRYPAALRFVPLFQRPKVVLATLVMRLRTAWRTFRGTAYEPPLNPTYRAEGFDERGDMVGHLQLPRPDTLIPGNNLPIDPRVVDAFFSHATDLLNHAQTARATVLFTWPSLVPEGDDPAHVERIAQQLEKRGLPTLGRPADYFFHESLRYDTRYHLHGHGRDERTRFMVRDVCAEYPDLCCGR